MRSSHTSRSMYLTTCLVVAAMLLISCGAAAPTPTKAPPTPTSVPADTTPIKIGWIGAKSGTMAMLGEWDTRGILMAFETRNAAGGIHGRQLQLIEYDDEADPTKAVGLAEKLCTEDKVVAAFATTNSTPTLAVVPIFAKYKVPHITGGINAQITQQGSAYVFRDTAVGSAYEKAIVDYMVGKGFAKFAIIADNSAYGQGEADLQEAFLREHGLTALTREIYAGEDKDFTGQITKIIQTGAEVLLFAGADVPSGLIALQARSMGFEGAYAGPGSVGTPMFVETAGEAAEGIFFSAPFITPDQDDETKAYVALYQKRWGEPGESHGAKAYDGAQLLIMALEAAYPNITGETVAAELHKICNYKGVQGEWCFDETGEGLTAMNIGTIQNGVVVPVLQ